MTREQMIDRAVRRVLPDERWQAGLYVPAHWDGPWRAQSVMLNAIACRYMPDLARMTRAEFRRIAAEQAHA